MRPRSAPSGSRCTITHLGADRPSPLRSRSGPKATPSDDHRQTPLPKDIGEDRVGHREERRPRGRPRQEEQPEAAQPKRQPQGDGEEAGADQPRSSPQGRLRHRVEVVERDAHLYGNEVGRHAGADEQRAPKPGEILEPARSDHADSSAPGPSPTRRYRASGYLARSARPAEPRRSLRGSLRGRSNSRSCSGTRGHRDAARPR